MESIVGIIALVAVFTTVSGSYQIDIAKSPAQTLLVEQGADVILKCYISGADYRYYLNPTHWKKMQDFTTEGDILMNNGAIPINGFEIPARKFVVSGNPQPELDGYLFSMAIYNVAPSDTGIYSCNLMGQNTQGVIKLSHSVTVKEDIVNVTLSGGKKLNQTNSSPKGDVLHFVEGEGADLMCESYGGVPQPMLSVSIGGRDITTELIKKTSALYDASAPQGQKSVTYYQRRYSTSYRAQGMDDGQTVTCMGKIPGSNQTTESTAVLDIIYKPIFMNCSEEIPVPRSARKFTISCKVTSNPAPDFNALTWELAEQNPSLSLTHLMSQNGYTVENSMVERTITTTLTIEYVEESDYQTLVLKASNAQGNSQFAMTLKPAPGIISSASGLKATALVFLMALYQLLL